MQCLEVQSFSILLRGVVLRNLKMQHLRNKGVMFFKLHTHSTHFDVCSFFYDLGWYLWKRSESPQGGQPHSLRNATFCIFLSYVLLDFRTGNLLTDVLNQSCLPDYHRGHSYYEGVFYISSEQWGRGEVCSCKQAGYCSSVTMNKQVENE